MTYRVAVAGATGNVGRAMLEILAARDFPVARLDALASARSVGVALPFGDAEVQVAALEAHDFSDTDIALFACGSGATAEHAPRAAESGCVVIDNSSLYRMESDVPLVVPEVNGAALADFKRRNIIANPNCSTAQLVVALKPLHDIAPIVRVVVATYQSVSGAGQAAMQALRDETAEGENAEATASRIAFNVVPQIGDMQADGITGEERKMAVETQKILGAPVALTASCVRVPVFIGHSEAVNVAFAAPISPEDACAALASAPGVKLVETGYITPRECAGDDAVFVSRIRRDPTIEHGLDMWVVSDNLRKGAALNAVQIAEALARDHL